MDGRQHSYRGLSLIDGHPIASVIDLFQTRVSSQLNRVKTLFPLATTRRRTRAPMHRLTTSPMGPNFWWVRGRSINWHRYRYPALEIRVDSLKHEFLSTNRDSRSYETPRHPSKRPLTGTLVMVAAGHRRRPLPRSTSLIPLLFFLRGMVVKDDVQ